MSAKSVLPRIEDAITAYVEIPEAQLKAEAARLAGELPAPQVAQLDSIVAYPALSYRNAALIQLGYGLVGVKDLTRRHAGARTLGKEVGTVLRRLHIPSVNDAYENIGKNAAILIRGNLKEFDDFLEWATDTATEEEKRAAFDYLAVQLAMLARPVREMPRLDPTRLDYASVMALLTDLLRRGSRGVYEQFTVAALLHALLQQVGLVGYRVETKHISASDASSGTAGDIQIFAPGNRLVEGFEVTANSYTEKLEGAERTVRSYDLSRLHVIAQAEEPDAMLEMLARLPVEVTVIDIYAAVSMLTAILERRYRAVALERLYELLDRLQPDVEKVNDFVGAIEARGLVAE